MKIIYLFIFISISVIGYSQSKQEERNIYIQNKTLKEKINSYNTLVQLPHSSKVIIYDKTKLETILNEKDGINYFIETEKGDYKINCSNHITKESLMEIFLMVGIRPEQIESIATH